MITTTSENLRILHCAETIKGGIATYLRELIPLQSATYGVHNIFVLIPESQKVELLVPAGVNVQTYPDNGGRVVNAIRLALRTLKMARHEHINILHVHSSFAGFTVRPLIAIGCRAVRVVYCAHGWAWDRPMSAFNKYIVSITERYLAKLTDRIICISEHDYYMALNAGIAKTKLVVIKNAVSAQPPLMENLKPMWPSDKLRLLFVGRLDKQKGVDVLVAALDLLEDNVHTVIAGATVLDDGAAKLVLPKNATLIGWLSPGNLQALFAQAQILVMPSRWEGFGLVATEAMRAGLPVIASRVGGLPEVVEDGVTGLIVPPESPVALAEAIQSLDEFDLQRMGQAGRERVVKLFTIDRLHNELCAVYENTAIKRTQKFYE